MITVSITNNLGNQMWQYAVGRTVAERLGYEFHIPRPFLGSELFANCDLGVENSIVHGQWPTGNAWSFRQPYDSSIFQIADFTEINGWLQSEHYIVDNRKKILEWFTLKNQPSQLLQDLELDDDTCVINFRGGEDYKTHILDWFLHKNYYYNAIAQIKRINSNAKFLVITNDIEEAARFFPNYRIYHFDILRDYYAVNQARYLIIANSTFSWWASWLNQRTQFTIAPKYWLNYSTGTGRWLPSDSITSRYHYVDDVGNLLTAQQCMDELTADNYMDYTYVSKQDNQAYFVC